MKRLIPLLAALALLAALPACQNPSAQKGEGSSDQETASGEQQKEQQAQQAQNKQAGDPNDPRPKKLDKASLDKAVKLAEQVAKQREHQARGGQAGEQAGQAAGANEQPYGGSVEVNLESPKAAAQTFINAMRARDLEAVEQVQPAFRKKLEDLGPSKSQMALGLGQEMARKVEIVGVVDETEDSATVQVQLAGADKTSDMQLRKGEKGWVVTGGALTP